jgi:hypothetical protein
MVADRDNRSPVDSVLEAVSVFREAKLPPHIIQAIQSTSGIMPGSALHNSFTRELDELMKESKAREVPQAPGREDMVNFTSLKKSCQVPDALGRQYYYNALINEESVGLNRSELVYLGCELKHHSTHEECGEHLVLSERTVRNRANFVINKFREAGVDVPIMEGAIIQAYRIGLVTVDPGEQVNSPSGPFRQIWPVTPFHSQDSRGVDQQVFIDSRFARDARLSPRLLDITGCVMAGRLTNGDVADCLNLVLGTIRNQMGEIVRRVAEVEGFEGVTSKSGLVAELLANGVVKFKDPSLVTTT